MAGAASHHDNELVLDVLRLEEPAFAVNDAHQIVAWNDGAERLLGLRAEQMIGLRCYEALAVTDSALCLACRYRSGSAARAMAAGEPGESTTLVAARRRMSLSARHRTASAAARHVSVTTIAAHTRTGQVRFVHLLQDAQDQPGAVSPADATLASADAGPTSGLPTRERHISSPLHALEESSYAAMTAPAESGSRQRRPAALTQRELEVLRLLGAGHSTDDISRELSITRVTARNHVNKVLDKLGVNSRLQAVVIASQLQLI
jgi:DNA-binding CsgD family transcriptional regulator